MKKKNITDEEFVNLIANANDILMEKFVNDINEGIKNLMNEPLFKKMIDLKTKNI